MAEKAKTTPTGLPVSGFLAAIEDDARRADALALCALLEEVTKQPPVMWGPSIVGFGSYRYRYESGRTGEAVRIGFSPRKANLTIYIMSGFEGCSDIIARLGKAKTSLSCLHVKRLADVDAAVLRELFVWTLEEMERRYPQSP